MGRGEPPPGTHIPGDCCHQRTSPTAPPALRARPPLGREQRLWSQTRAHGVPTLRGRGPALSDLSFSTRAMGPAGVSPDTFRRTALRGLSSGSPRATTTPFPARRPCPTAGRNRPLSPPPPLSPMVLPGRRVEDMGTKGVMSGLPICSRAQPGSSWAPPSWKLTLGGSGPDHRERHRRSRPACPPACCSSEAGHPRPSLQSTFVQHLPCANTEVTQLVRLARRAAPGKV